MAATLPELTELFESLERIWEPSELDPQPAPESPDSRAMTAPAFTITQLPAVVSQPCQPTVGRRVRELRLRFGRPIVEAAFLAGLQPTIWWAIERGQLEPLPTQLAAMATALRAQLAALTG
jgi:hypothetical protein